MGFGGQGGAGGSDGGVDVGGGEGFALQGGFGGGAADGAVGEGGGAETDVGEFVVFDEGEAGEGDLGDGLRVAGADFADVLAVAGEGARDGDGVEELVGTECGLFVAEVEVGVGDGAGAG